MSPLRAARSSSRAAIANALPAASPVTAVRTRFTAVRRAERCPLLRTARVRAWRIAFLADLIFGTSQGLPSEGRKLDGKLRRVKALRYLGPGRPGAPIQPRDPATDAALRDVDQLGAGVFQPDPDPATRRQPRAEAAAPPGGRHAVPAAVCAGDHPDHAGHLAPSRGGEHLP